MSAALAQHFGNKVLLVDIDPQTNLTFLCSSIEDWEQFKKKTGTIATMYRRFLEKKSLDTKRFIWRQPVGAGSFPALELLRSQSREYLREHSFLQKALNEVDDNYDYILIERWPRNFEQGVKWKLGLTGGMFCLRIRSEDEEASPPEPHTGLQGEGGPGCPEERSNDCAAC